jgi:hypothetical protein
VNRTSLFLITGAFFAVLSTSAMGFKDVGASVHQENEEISYARVMVQKSSLLRGEDV